MALQVSSYDRAVAVTPSDTTVLECKGFYVGGAGNVSLQTKAPGPSTTGDTAVVLTACVVGTIYPIAAYRIMAATTATLVIALY